MSCEEENMERGFRVQMVQNLHGLDLCACLSLSGGKKEPNQLVLIVLSGNTAGPQSPLGFYSFCPHPAYVIMTLQKHPAFRTKPVVLPLIISVFKELKHYFKTMFKINPASTWVTATVLSDQSERA